MPSSPLTANAMKKRSSLLELPPELLSHICAHLQHPDLKNARLACRKLADIGAETLLADVVVVYTTESFQRLRNISEHPILAQHVKRLIYEGSRIDFFTKDQWRIEVLDRLYWRREYEQKMVRAGEAGAKLCSPAYTPQEFAEGWSCYQTLRKNQEKIYRTGMDVTELDFAIRHFPRLEAVHVDIGSGSIYPKNSDHFRKSYRACLIEPEFENMLKDRSPPGLRQFHSCLSCLSRIKVLEASRISWLGIKSSAVVDVSLLQDKTLELTELRLDFDLGEDPDSDILDDDERGAFQACSQAFREHGILRKLISICPHLKKLSVGFDEIFSDSGSQAAELKQIFDPRTTLPCLEEVSFQAILVEEDALLDFLRRHKSTLRKIILHDICLQRDRQWSDVLRNVRDLNLEHDALEEFQVSGNLWVEDVAFPFSTPQLRRPLPPNHPVTMIDDFLLKKSDFNPLTEPGGVVLQDDGTSLWPGGMVGPYDEDEDGIENDDSDVDEGDSEEEWEDAETDSSEGHSDDCGEASMASSLPDLVDRNTELGGPDDALPDLIDVE